MLEKQVSAIRFDTFLDKIWTLELGGCLGGTLGPHDVPKSVHFHVLGTPFGYIGHCRGALWVPRGTPLAPFGHTLEATSTMLGPCLQKCSKNPYF